MRRLSHLARHLAPRALVLVVAALFSVMPVWAAAQALAVACAETAPDAPPAAPLDEEESVEGVALHRHHLDLRRLAHPREKRVAVAGVAFRHLREWDTARVQRRWAIYRAPPRAPPPRLLN